MTNAFDLTNTKQSIYNKDYNRQTHGQKTPSHSNSWYCYEVPKMKRNTNIQ